MKLRDLFHTHRTTGKFPDSASPSEIASAKLLLAHGHHPDHLPARFSLTGLLAALRGGLTVKQLQVHFPHPTRITMPLVKGYLLSLGITPQRGRPRKLSKNEK
jgi:hypothetical protein